LPNISRCLVITPYKPVLFSRPHLFTAHDMAEHSRSARFQELFESALQAYEKKTGIILAQHPLSVQLQSCHSARDITALLQGRAQAFSDFRTGDRIMMSIKATVSIITPLSDAASLVDAIGLVRQKALVTPFASLIVFLRHHSHPRRQYRLVSLSYLMCVPFSRSPVAINVTSKSTRRLKA
jgi:hypothetical protein